jgi:hypothetical protein
MRDLEFCPQVEVTMKTVVHIRPITFCVCCTFFSVLSLSLSSPFSFSHSVLNSLFINLHSSCTVWAYNNINIF